jgi:hypothetical protein
VNVCGVGPLEDRQRGGCRKGLAKVVATDFGSSILWVAPVTYLDTASAHKSALIVIADGNLFVLNGATVSTVIGDLVLGSDAFQIDGQNIGFPSVVATPTINAVWIGQAITIGAEELTFTSYGGGPVSSAQRLGKLYMSGTKLQVYDPATGVLYDAPGAPTAEPLVCVYRDRIILAGKNHLGYASRVSDPDDWDFGADIDDSTKPVVFQLSEAGQIGEGLTAMIPWRDKHLIFATENGLWVLNGDPATGSIDQISAEIGVISANAWCILDNGMIAFLSNDGVYLWGVGGGYPVRFSEERLPRSLRNVDPDTNDIVLSYDAKERGIWIFVTPLSGVGTHWFMDMTQKAIWEMRFGANGHQPKAVARYDDDDGIKDVILGCRDGYLRKFSTSATDDDGTDIGSHVAFGAFHLAGDMRDGLLAEIQGALADDSESVTWRVFMGSTAEEAMDTAVAAIDALVAGTDPVSVKASGTWVEKFNRVARPRTRGAWCVVVLSSAGRWAFEGMSLVANILGRQRQ